MRVQDKNISADWAWKKKKVLIDWECGKGLHTVAKYDHSDIRRHVMNECGEDPPTDDSDGNRLTMTAMDVHISRVNIRR